MKNIKNFKKQIQSIKFDKTKHNETIKKHLLSFEN